MDEWSGVEGRGVPLFSEMEWMRTPSEVAGKSELFPGADYLMDGKFSLTYAEILYFLFFILGDPLLSLSH